MQRSCSTCTRDVFFSFVSAVTGTRQNNLLQREWLQHQRYLSNDVRTVGSSNNAKITQHSDAIDRDIPPLYRPTQSANRRAANTDEKTNGQQYEEIVKAITGATGQSISTPIAGARKKDRWRNRPKTADGTIIRQTRSRGTAEGSGEASTSEAGSFKPKKDRWRDRPPRGISERRTMTDNKSATAAVDSRRVKTIADERRQKQHSTTTASLPKLLRDIQRPIHAPISPEKKLEPWQIHKEAIKKKLNGEQWSPFKKLSPDAMQGVRQLHAEDAKLWSTPNLAKHFEVSPDAIRRILKSKWTPSEEERARQEERWEKRGETIWDRYVELGMKAPRKWRGLDPVPAAKRPNPVSKAEYKPEEWSKDPMSRPEQDTPGLGLGIEDRIV